MGDSVPDDCGQAHKGSFPVTFALGPDLTLWQWMPHFQSWAPEARDWNALAVLSPCVDARPDPDRHMGGCILGDPLLRKAWLPDG